MQNALAPIMLGLSLVSGCMPTQVSEINRRSKIERDPPSSVGVEDSGHAIAPVAPQDSGTNTPPKTFEQRVETRTQGEILCQEGPRVTMTTGDDFSELFKTVCDGDSTNPTFDMALRSAYQGEGEPEINLIYATTNELFVTHLRFIYSVKIPLSSPDQVADLNLFEIFAKGLTDADGRSSMRLAIGERKLFPGGGSVEEVNLEYSLKLADGAALFDKRKSRVQNYLPSEATRDLTLSAEYLVDADTNPYYHAARQMILGVKSENNTTTLIYLNEMIVKNRIDPARLQRTLLNLSKVLARTTFDTASKAQP